jgi:nucleotide-binding universal stress UspA family protein
MKILIPVDGSKMSEHVVKKAAEIGKQFAADLTLFVVIPEDAAFDRIPFPGASFPYTEDIEKTNEENAKKVLEQMKKVLEAYPNKVETIYKKGRPSTQIVNYAKDNKYDLIVMGNRGLGAFSRTLLGSVSSKVLDHSPVSVFVIKGEIE